MEKKKEVNHILKNTGMKMSKEINRTRSVEICCRGEKGRPLKFTF